jgi:hypothetical protein
VKLIHGEKMKRKLMSVLSVLIIAVLSACGSDATPTMSVADAQNTAIAAAFVALTQTQAAIPTATETPVPPTPTETFTPAPTNTAFPTLVPPTLPDTSATDPCNEPPPIEPVGATVKVTFSNKADGSLNLAFGLTKENDKKECGTYNFTIGRYEQPEVTVLAGCYWGYAWILDPPSTAKTPNVICLTDTSKTYSVWITSEVINIH